jgi:hypothetical protein
VESYQVSCAQARHSEDPGSEGAADTDRTWKMLEEKKMKAIVNPIIVPMSSYSETLIPEQISTPLKEATRAKLLKHFKEVEK